MRKLLLSMAAFPLLAAPAETDTQFLRVPVWMDAKQAAVPAPAVAEFTARLDGEPAPVVAAQGPGDDLLVVLVLDWSEDIALVDAAKAALSQAIQHMPPQAYLAVFRAQDGLNVLMDPTTNRGALDAAVQALAVNGRPGLLDTVETADRVADAILAKAAVRVAVVYISDSNIYSYREDFVNPVINTSDKHDLSRRFPDVLVREKISTLAGKLAGFQPPVFIVHLAYGHDRMNKAYQSGLTQLASTTGGAAVFCRSRAEIAGAIAHTFDTVASHYSIKLGLPKKASRIVQVEVQSEGHTLTYRNRFAFPGR